jgi:hypothetical protein
MSCARLDFDGVTAMPDVEQTGRDAFVRPHDDLFFGVRYQIVWNLPPVPSWLRIA